MLASSSLGGTLLLRLAVLESACLLGKAGLQAQVVLAVLCGCEGAPGEEGCRLAIGRLDYDIQIETQGRQL